MQLGRLLVAMVAFCLLSGCSALRFGSHFMDVNIGENMGSRTLSESPERDRQFLIDVDATPPVAAPPVDPQPPIAVDMEAPVHPPSPAPPSAGPPSDTVALTLVCRESVRPHEVETEHLTRSFSFVERLVYGIIMLFEAATFVGIVFGIFRGNNPEELVPAIAFASLFGADFVGWALLVAFMPTHEHGSVSNGPGRWSTPVQVPCPDDVQVSVNGRLIPLVRDGQFLVLDDLYVVGDLARGHPLSVRYPNVSDAPQLLTPSSERVCGWAASDQLTPWCDRPTQNSPARFALPPQGAPQAFVPLRRFVPTSGPVARVQ